MRDTQFQAPELSRSAVEDFLIFSMYFYGPITGPSWAGPFWTGEGALFEQTC